jgi:predicted RecA/RadA family phage recombinase
MAQAIFIHEGGAVDYTPAADVAAGDVVVQGDLVGVAKQPIATGRLGALAVQGVFDFAKATGAGTAIAVGAVVYWDATAEEATTSDGAGANKLIGKAVRAAADGDAVVRVRMNQ